MLYDIHSTLDLKNIDLSRDGGVQGSAAETGDKRLLLF